MDPPREQALAGRTIGVTADRRAAEQIAALERRGAGVIHGPTMRTVDLTADGALRAATDALIDRPPDWLVVTTGMGLRLWLEAADGWGVRPSLLGVLEQSRIVARGAKSASAARQAGLTVSWRAPGESMVEVVRHVQDQATSGARLALQLFDPDDHPASVALAAVGDVVEVPVYRWLLPVDRGPAEALIAAAVAGEVDAVTFTSQPAVRNLFRIAEGAGAGDQLRDALDRRVLAVCIGPVCAEALHDAGITNTRWPEPFRLVPMVDLVADLLGPGEGSAIS
ncbi:hypothetical protein BH20ACT2_BH20ACT2_15820 [soil metagenome]